MIDLPPAPAVPALTGPCCATVIGAAHPPTPITPITQAGKYSTTSTVYAEYSLANPHNDQLLYCIAAIIQAQIFEDLTAPRALQGEDFILLVALASEQGGPLDCIPVALLAHESMHDHALRAALLSHQVPTCETVYSYLLLLSRAAGFGAECNVIALVYVNRIATHHSLALTMSNWRGLWTAAVILAQKVWDDTSLRTSAFAPLLAVDKGALRAMELRVFVLLDYCAIVSPSTYAKYYFELRALFRDLGRGLWQLRPLTIAQGMRLQQRSSRGLGKQQHCHSPKHATNGISTSSSSKRREAVPRTYEDATFTPTPSRFVLHL